jgi:tetratricopeptide (TPR) repeat protein
MRRSLIVAAALLLISVCSGFSDSRQNASWLLYEQANAAMDQREFGRALQLYKEALAAAGVFPEAEIGLGDVYLEEGEVELARAQYEKAYSMRKSFYIPDMQYDISYKLAHMYEGQGLYKLMEDWLNKIVVDDRHFAESDTYRLRSQVEKLYKEKGIDRTLVLYSLDDSFAAAAHSKLGWFYYRTGRFTQAVSQLLFSVINRVSALNSVLHERDVDYGFSSLKDLLETTEKTTDLREYAVHYDLYKDLYYLAGATFADGYPQHSRQLWQLIASSQAAGTYAELSRKQLKTPWIEPLISATSAGSAQ